MVWLFESVVGMIPLLAHYFIRIFSAYDAHPAMCLDGLHNCQLLPETPYPEICILAVVTAGMSLIAALGFSHRSQRRHLTSLTHALMFLSLTACLLGFGMYALATAGLLRGSVAWVTWCVLLTALVSSLGLSLDTVFWQVDIESPHFEIQHLRLL